jgi:hypothetical protein
VVTVVLAVAVIKAVAVAAVQALQVQAQQVLLAVMAEMELHHPIQDHQ